MIRRALVAAGIVFGSFVSFASLASFASCSSPPKPEAPPPAKDGGTGSAVPVERGDHYTPEQQEIHLDEPKLDLPKQESFKLVDAGTGERAPLVYAYAAGSAETTIETKLASRHLDNGTWSAKLELPPIRDGFAVIVDAGHAVIRGLAGSIAGTSTPEAEQYIANWRTLLQNRRATVDLDARGQLGKIAFADDPTNARSERSREELAQRLLVMMVPVPAEPVGIGASWKVVTVLRQGPASVKQTATYTLVARTPERWTIGVKLLRLGQEQLVVDPSLPKGARVDLVALLRKLDGTVEIDPKRAMIDKGSLAVESRVHAKIIVPGQPAVEQMLEDTGTVTIGGRRR